MTKSKRSLDDQRGKAKGCGWIRRNAGELSKLNLGQGGERQDQTLVPMSNAIRGECCSVEVEHRGNLDERLTFKILPIGANWVSGLNERGRDGNWEKHQKKERTRVGKMK
jgi:hypothetical protein